MKLQSAKPRAARSIHQPIAVKLALVNFYRTLVMNSQPPSADQQFLELADSFIRLANKQCADHDLSPGRVSAAFVYAAARFNAFLVASSMTSAEELQAEVPAATAYFTGEFERMVKEHLADHVTHFDRYCDSQTEGFQERGAAH
jgi:hypothetical protein